MVFKVSMLSRLFRFGGKKEKEDGNEKEYFLPAEQEAKETFSSPEPPDPLCLVLPPEHAFYQLWLLSSGKTEVLPMPVLRLGKEGEQESIVPEKKLQRELERLYYMITSTAEARLALIKKAVPELKEAVGEETEAAAEAGRTEYTGPDLDASAEVFLTEDEMSAWLLVYPPVGKGREADRELLENALDKKRVIFGVKNALLERIPKDKERYFHLFPAAEGIRPIDGSDGEIIDFFPRNWKPEVRLDDLGNADYTELDFAQNINEGDTICQIIDPAKNEPGMTVTNRAVPPKVGKKPRIPKGRNTTVTEDGSRLIATKTGHVEFSGQGFQVKPVLEIFGNIDYSTGNINFLGDVHIKGNVCSGFSVQATGNIIIEGVLEAGTVKAGGDLIVRKGIKGDLQLIIHVGRSLYTKYLENTTVCVKERLESGCVINCNVYSDGDVQVCSGRGILVGGVVRASGEIRANIVGSRSEHRTIVCMGGLPSEEFELECLRQEIKDLQAEYEKLEEQPDSPAKAKKLGMVRMKLSVNREKLDQFTKLLKEAQENTGTQSADSEGEEKAKKQEKHKDNRKLVCGTAYGGTEIHIGEAVLTLNHEVRFCTAVLREDEICLI